MKLYKTKDGRMILGYDIKSSGNGFDIVKGVCLSDCKISIFKGYSLTLCEDVIKLKTSDSYSRDEDFVVMTFGNLFFHSKNDDRVFAMDYNSDEKLQVAGRISYEKFEHYMNYHSETVGKFESNVIEFKNKSKDNGV